MKKKVFRNTCLALAAMMGLSGGMTMDAQAQLYVDRDSTATWTWAKEHIDWASNRGIISGKPGNIFDADGMVTRAEAATMIVNFKGIDVTNYDRPCTKFEDVGDEWYAKYINAAYANGLVSGKSENTFDPEGELTRAEAATLIVGAMKYELPGEEQESYFTDIDGEWYTSYISAAYEHEVVSGKGEGKFAPEENVSRAEIVTMIHGTQKENFEIGLMSAMRIDKYIDNLILTNAEGQVLEYKDGDETQNTMDAQVIWSIGGPTESAIYMDATASLVYENGGDETAVHFWGANSAVDVTGSNIDKIVVSADGVLCLYGENMEYSVKWANCAHTLDWSGTAEKGVVLTVMDGQIVETSYEVGEMNHLTLFDNNGYFKFTNAEGNVFEYELGEEKQNTMNAELTWYIAMPAPCSILMDTTTSLTYEMNSEVETDILIFGDKSHVTVTGSNLEKMTLDAEGNLHLYGTDMEYVVKWNNLVYELEYSGSSASDVVLTVVGAQIVEVTE